jgi:hypothetical protein
LLFSLTASDFGSGRRRRFRSYRARL